MTKHRQISFRRSVDPSTPTAVQRQVQVGHSQRVSTCVAMAVGELLRSEGLYSSHLVTWLGSGCSELAGLTPKKRGRKKRRWTSAIARSSNCSVRNPAHGPCRAGQALVDLKKTVLSAGRPPARRETPVCIPSGAERMAACFLVFREP